MRLTGWLSTLRSWLGGFNRKTQPSPVEAAQPKRAIAKGLVECARTTGSKRFQLLFTGGRANRAPTLTQQRESKRLENKLGFRSVARLGCLYPSHNGTFTDKHTQGGKHMNRERKALSAKLAVALFVIATASALAAEEAPSKATTESKKTAIAAAKEPASFSKGYQAYRGGKLDEAIAAFQQAAKENPDHALSFQFLGRACYEKKRYAEAIKAAKQVTKLAPDNARNWRTLGLAQMATDDIKTAVESFTQAAKIEPKSFWTQNDLGFALLQLNHNGEACKALERAVEIDASKAMTWNTLGVARLRLGDRKGAIEAFKKALQLDPNHAKAKANLAATESEKTPTTK